MPQIVLGGEGEFLEIGMLFQIGGVDAGRIELFLVVRDTFVGLIKGLFQALKLQRSERIAGRRNTPSENLWLGGAVGGMIVANLIFFWTAL